ncbi:MAG: polyprenyl synthetase family protein, partial [Prevotella sp.]|nr:polyprenyl synthetase family protein [Prevotella sp.]
NSMGNLAKKVKSGTVNMDEIAVLVDFAKECGGIEYAERKMMEFHQKAQSFLDSYVIQPDIKDALQQYLDFAMKRTN